MPADHVPRVFEWSASPLKRASQPLEDNPTKQVFLFGLMLFLNSHTKPTFQSGAALSGGCRFPTRPLPVEVMVSFPSFASQRPFSKLDLVFHQNDGVKQALQQ